MVLGSQFFSNVISFYGNSGARTNYAAITCVHLVSTSCWETKHVAVDVVMRVQASRRAIVNVLTGGADLIHWKKPFNFCFVFLPIFRLRIITTTKILDRYCFPHSSSCGEIEDNNKTAVTSKK